MKAFRLSGITLPGTGYQPLSFFLPIPGPVFPVSAGLVGLYVFGKTEGLSLVNDANSALPLLKVGAPVVNTLGASTTQPNCFDTQIASPAGLTIITAAKLHKTGSQDYMMCSNYINGGTGNTGDSLYFNGTSLVASGNTTGATPTTATLDLSTGTAGEWNSFAARIKSGTSQARAWWQKSGALTVGVETGALTRSLLARTLRVGGHYESTQFQLPGDVLMCAIFNTALADADVASNMAYLNTTWGPSVGVSTL